jgi:hypothetical protein
VPPFKRPATPSPEPRTKERLAIDIADLDGIELVTRQRLLADYVVDTAIEVKRGDWALEFTCELLPAAAICDTARQIRPIKVYINRGQGWSKVKDDVRLAILESGRLILNPAIFPRSNAGEVVLPAPAEKVYIPKWKGKGKK